MTHLKGDASLPRQRRSFTVKASPFNSVKLDLAVIFILGFLLFLIHDRIVDGELFQLAILAAYGVVAMIWVVFRTRRVSKKLAENTPESVLEVEQKD